VDAAQHAAKAKNRKEISAAIAPTNRLDQPIPVIERALTRRHADGPGNIMNVPDRIGFDPFPWHFMGVRTLIQLKRLVGIESDVDCRGVAVRVCLAGDSAKIMRDSSYDAPGIARKSRAIMGKAVDPATPEAYVKSFAIAKGRSMTLSRRFRVALVLPAISFVAPGAWEPSIPAQKAVGERMEYEVPMGSGARKAGVPPSLPSRDQGMRAAAGPAP
jgi:hypothetical protein